MNNFNYRYDEVLELMHKTITEINTSLENAVNLIKITGEKARLDKVALAILQTLERHGPKSVSELDRKFCVGIAIIQRELDQLVKQGTVKVNAKRTFYSEGKTVSFYSLNWELWTELHNMQNELPLKSNSCHKLMPWIHDIKNSKALSEIELIELLKFTCDQLHDHIANLSQSGDISSANRIENRVKAMLSHFESAPSNDYPDW